MVTEQIKFVAEDGKEFNNRLDAEKYEKNLPLTKKLDDVFDDYPKPNGQGWDDTHVTTDSSDEPIIYTYNLGKFLVANLILIKKIFGLLDADEVRYLVNDAYAEGKRAASEDDSE